MSDYSDDDGAYYESDDTDGMEGFEDDEDEHIFAQQCVKDRVVDLTVPHGSFGPEGLREEIDKEAAAVSSVLGVDNNLAVILLLHYRWNRERLIDQYSESPSEVLAAVGEPEAQDVVDMDMEVKPTIKASVSVSAKATNGPSSSGGGVLKGLKSLRSPYTRKKARRGASPSTLTIVPEPDNLCGVCFDALVNSAGGGVPSMRCGHSFCRDCWEAYLTSKIKDEGQCSIKCMADKCRTSLYEGFIRDITSNDVYNRWQMLLAQSFVSSNPSLRFCPAPSCDQTLLCTSAPIGSSALLTTVPTLSCSKAHVVCFGCGMENGHCPVICKIASLWVASKDDAGTGKWIEANTRKCPKCSNNIEKAGGCNRMLCRHCKYQFCWMCMKKWEVHGYNDSVCNAFVEPPRTADMDEAKVNLERWLFYFDRFNNHEVSAKLDQELVERTQEKMLEIQNTSDLSWIETHFMQNAVDELTKCRQTLKWTYAMAHFMSAGNQKIMFEDIQADLEKAVEDLSQLLDASIEDENIRELRLKVLDKTIYVQKRHEVMLVDVAKGFLEDTWKWTVAVE